VPVNVTPVTVLPLLMSVIGTVPPFTVMVYSTDSVPAVFGVNVHARLHEEFVVNVAPQFDPFV
jgi:hypothetical protein